MFRSDDKTAATAIDPDVDVHVRDQRRELQRGRWTVIGAVSAGGVIGATARHGLEQALPHEPGGLPWAILTANLTGCLLIGVLMALIAERWSGHRLLRPFLGTGVLGGYTTFSTYVLDIQRLSDAGHALTALIYMAATLIGALAAVWIGLSLTRRALAARRTEVDR